MQYKNHKTRVAILFLLLPALPLNTVTAAEPPPPGATTPGTAAPGTAAPVQTGNGKVLLNFQNADIQAVIKTVSQLTDRNFLLDPRVKGKITIISTRPVSKRAAYDIFLSALNAHGFTAIPQSTGVVKVVPVGEAKQLAPIDERRVRGDHIITRVIIVQNAEAAQLVPILRPLMALTSQLSAYPAANALVVSDYAENITRLTAIINEIDRPLSSDVVVIPLRHASAVDIAELLSSLQPGTATAKTPGSPMGVVVVPDLRTNSLLVRGENPGQVQQIKDLVAQLDVSPRDTGSTRVIYLRNADAEKLAEILRGLMEAKTAGVAGKPAAATASIIQADKSTNALIINAPDAVYNNLRAVVEKLDIRRAQVFVEAMIAEINSDKAYELGFQWGAAGAVGDGVVGAISNLPSASGVGLGALAVDPTALASASGVSLAYLGPEITLPDGSTVRNLAGLARALEQRSAGNILSTPNLLTLDNAEAKIIVGQNVPFLTGSFAQATGTGTTVNPFQTIERKDIGLTLRIKPQISEGGAVKLDIFQEVSSVSRTAVSGASDLITNKRSLETRVVVDDGHTVVLGGLIEDTVQDTRQQVPGLGSIPILGSLFRYKNKSKVKTNLMIFLRPTIVRTARESRRVTMDKYDRLMSGSRAIPKEHRELLEGIKPGKEPSGPPAEEAPASDEPLGPPAAAEPQ